MRKISIVRVVQIIQNGIGSAIINRVVLGAIGIVAAISVSLVPTADAHAASNWDNMFDPVSTLILGNNYCDQTEFKPHDASKTFISEMEITSPTAFSSFKIAVGGGGNWLIWSQGGTLRMIWSQTPMTLTFSTIPTYPGSPDDDYITKLSSASDIEIYSFAGYVNAYPSHYCSTTMYGSSIYNASYSTTSEDVHLWTANPTSPLPVWDVNLDYITYPSGYAGEYLTTSTTDSDGDGLSNLKEQVQGTSDSNPDTDGDGVGYYRTSSDYTESVWNTNRDDEFCKTTVTPHVCSYPDPTKKDLYVQIDWLDDGTTSYKPTSTQLGLVAAKYAALGINFHADTGEYGGGDEISSSEQPTTIAGDLSGSNDFYNHKYGNGVETAHFDATNRYKIWRYMISGHNYDSGASGDTTSYGAAQVGGDDSFISYGLLKNNFSAGTSLDNAVAGIIVHELGHNLCLSSTAVYTGQDSSCVFSGVDTNATSNYKSAMNYLYTINNTYSYSDGTNGTFDHDDVGAIELGFGDFAWNDDDSDVGGL